MGRERTMVRLVAMSCAILLVGCGESLCSKFQDVANDCGGTLNQASCENALPSCTSSDQSIMSDLADCLKQPSVCNNGQVVNQTAEQNCVSAASGLSTSCQSATGIP